MILRGETLASMVLVAAGTTSGSANGRIGGYLWSGDGAGGCGGSRTNIDIKMPGNDQLVLLTSTTILGIDDTDTDLRDETLSGGCFPSPEAVTAAPDNHIGVGRHVVSAGGGVELEY